MFARNTSLTEEARMMDEKTGCAYTSLGRSSFRKFATEIGAAKRIGRRVLYDRRIIDSALDNLEG